MKTFFLLLGLLAVAGGPVAATPGASRPLVRYLTATLHLHRHKARQVQRAVLRNPLQVTTPEQVGARLRTVLNDAQYERYKALQNNVTSYEMLHRLATQH